MQYPVLSPEMFASANDPMNTHVDKKRRLKDRQRYKQAENRPTDKQMKRWSKPVDTNGIAAMT